MSKKQSKAVDCIACGQLIRVPMHLSASTRLSCPLCQSRFRLSDVLHQDLPMAQVENIEEDDDSSVLAPMEEDELRLPRQKKRSELKHPSSPRWKLATNKAEANNTRTSTDGGLLSSTGKQVFAEDFPYSAQAKEESRKEEQKQKERRSNFPKKRLSKKPISEQPFGRLKTSTSRPNGPEQGMTDPDGGDPMTMPMIPLHQPLPIKEKHIVLRSGTAQENQPQTSASATTQTGFENSAVDHVSENNTEPVSHSTPESKSSQESQKEPISGSELLTKEKRRTRRSEEPKRAPWVDLVVMIVCCLISLPLVQLGLWWVANVDPLGIAPAVRSVAPAVVPDKDSLN